MITQSTVVSSFSFVSRFLLFHPCHFQILFLLLLRHFFLFFFFIFIISSSFSSFSRNLPSLQFNFALPLFVATQHSTRECLFEIFYVSGGFHIFLWFFVGKVSVFIVSLLSRYYYIMVRLISFRKHVIVAIAHVLVCACNCLW